MLLTRLNPTTKKAGALVDAYHRATAEKLEDVYSSYSWEKGRAYELSKQMMKRLKGNGYKITGHNCNFFFCGFMGTYKKEKGLIYLTGRNSYFIPLEDREPMSLEEFSTRWQNNVSNNYKQRTAKALQGRTIASMEEAESILKAAEMFTILESLKLA